MATSSPLRAHAETSNTGPVAELITIYLPELYQPTTEWCPREPLDNAHLTPAHLALARCGRSTLTRRAPARVVTSGGSHEGPITVRYASDPGPGRGAEQSAVVISGRLALVSRIHDLRHTAAALMIQAGYPPKMLQEIMGHASITTTLDLYGHLYPGEMDRYTDRLDEAAGNTDAAKMRPNEDDDASGESA